MATINSVSSKIVSIGQQLTINGEGFTPSGSTPFVLFDTLDLSGAVFYYTDRIVEMLVPNIPPKEYGVKVDGSNTFLVSVQAEFQEPRSNLPRDFKIRNVSGLFEYTMDGTDGIENNVSLSLSIPKGSWWYNPNFGHELDSIKKITANLSADVETAVKNALQWLIDSGKIKDLSVSTGYDEDAKRVKANISVKDNTGAEFKFTRFIAVY